MELDKTSEARRKAQRNGEEDPVVVAQRFLNIYRQLHIFNAEKKAAFNKMLLELPPQIRGMFGQLPGGALLQDYVDELAEKEGIAKAAPTQTADIAEDDVKQAKILATALAEAQVQATAKMQEMGVQPAAVPLGGAAIQPQAAPAAAPAATTAKLAMDKTFAQEFATVLAAAMQKNAANQEIEIKNIINTLGQTQLEIIKVLQTENTEHREEMKNISQMMLQAQSQISAASTSAAADNRPQPAPKISEETKQLIRILLDGQKQLIERVAKVETIATAAAEKAPEPMTTGNSGQELAAVLEKSERNFSQMITALNERQKNDTLEIARLINESQQNLVQMMVQHNTLNQNSGNAAAANNNANNIQINSVDYSGVLNQIAERLGNLQPAVSAAPAPAANIQINFPEQAIGEIVKAQSQLYREIAAEQTKELSAIITLALKESQKASTQNIIDALSVRPVVIQTPTAPTYAGNPAAEVREPPAYTPPPILQDEIQPDDPVSAQPEVPLTDPIDLFGEEETPAAEEPQKESNVFVFNENTADDTASRENEDNQFPAEESETPKKKKRKKKKKKKKTANESAGAEEISATAAESAAIFGEKDLNEPADDISPVFDALPEHNEDTETDIEMPAPAAEAETSENQTGNLWLDNDPGEDTAVETESAEAPAVTLPEEAGSADDWGFTPVIKNQEEPSAATFSADDPSGENQDWEWVYEDTPDESTDNAGEGTEWEWEYIPEEASDSGFHSSALQPLADQSPICSGDLFFQEQVYNTQPAVNSIAAPYLDHMPGILDSAAAEQTADPYQNSARKD